MSSPHNHLPPLPVRERVACMCVLGESCSSFAPGHALHLIQARLASATPSEWVDAIVEQADPDNGIVVLRTVAHAEQVELWSGAGAAREAAPGSPVAFHGRYDVLAVGSLRFNVLRG
ncbi:MAG TPA: hypothetical protein VNP97_13325 [Microbacterium sp.]|nr:hypothetical protein [Microbacterium sp.]